MCVRIATALSQIRGYPANDFVYKSVNYLPFPHVVSETEDNEPRRQMQKYIYPMSDSNGICCRGEKHYDFYENSINRKVILRKYDSLRVLGFLHCREEKSRLESGQ